VIDLRVRIRQFLWSRSVARRRATLARGEGGHAPGSSLQARVDQHFWFHSIDLGNGLITPGQKSPDLLRREADAIFGPLDLRGKSVLDVGAWNGFFSFEAKRRHAARVLAIDHFCWGPAFNGKPTFDLARAALNLEVEDLYLDVLDLTRDRVGEFDVVLFLGVFYHLVDPIKALQRLAAIARQVMVVETYLDLRALRRPAMVFYPGAELANDAGNWWGPNRRCMEALLRLVGFERVVHKPHPVHHRRRGIFHAYKASGSPLLHPTP
jgi:tRNA (mo5U34)-methyltransferase